MTFVVDQMNGLTGDKTDEYEAKKRAKLYDWLLCFTSASKAVFSSSAKYSGYIKQSDKQNSNRVLHVYGGLTRVSYLNVTMSSQFAMRFLTRLGGNGPVVGATSRRCEGRRRTV
jgi:hypothetical protein